MRDARDRYADRDRGRLLDDRELDLAAALGQARDLPDGRRQPDLLGGRELQERRQVACPAACQEDVLLSTQGKREDGGRHRTER